MLFCIRWNSTHLTSSIMVTQSHGLSRLSTATCNSAMWNTSISRTFCSLILKSSPMHSKMQKSINTLAERMQDKQTTIKTQSIALRYDRETTRKQPRCEKTNNFCEEFLQCYRELKHKSPACTLLKIAWTAHQLNIYHTIIHNNTTAFHIQCKYYCRYQWIDKDNISRL